MRLIFYIKKTNISRSLMHRYSFTDLSSFCLPLAAALLCMVPASAVQARIHLPDKPSVELNLDVLQHLSDAAPALGAAPVDGVEEGEVGAYQPRREHAERRVPDENPYTPPIRTASTSKPTVKSSGSPFFFGESPAARIESRPLPRLKAKKKPVAKPVKMAKKAPLPVVKAAPKPVTPPPLPVVKVAPKPMTPPPPVKEMAAIIPEPAPLPVVDIPAALPTAPVVVDTPNIIPVPAPAVVPVLPQATAPRAPEVLVKREVPNNPMGMPLPDLPDFGGDASATELTALPPKITQRVEEAFAPPDVPNKGLTETRRVINPVAMREAERQANAATLPLDPPPPPLALPVPGGDVLALPEVPPATLPSVESLTDEPAGELQLATVDEQIFSTDPMAPVAGLEAPSVDDIKANQEKFAALNAPPSRGESGLGAVGDAKLSVGFQPNMQDIMPAEKDRLSDLAAQIRGDDGMVRIMAYAGGSPDQASMARRISLSRALSVRAFLIDKGVNQLRIEVKAKGNKGAGENPDRADVFIQ